MSTTRARSSVNRVSSLHTALRARTKAGAGRVGLAVWWLIAFPGGAMLAVLLCLNYLGDQLRDRWDPRLARRR